LTPKDEEVDAIIRDIEILDNSSDSDI